MTMNAAELLLRARGGLDDGQIALACEGEAVARGELRERVARLAGGWQRFGLRPGQVVAIRLDDGIAWVEAWLSVIWAGGVAVGVNPRLAPEEWHAACADARFTHVVDNTIAADHPSAHAHASIDLATLRAAAGAAAEPMARHDMHPAFWVHSSGTSGRPKGVVHAQRAVIDIARISSERLGLTSGDRLFASSRLFFTYPLVNGLLAGLRLGATLCIDPGWPTAASLAAFVQRHRPSVLFTVPALYRGLLHEGHAAALRGSTLRLAVSAGEALPPRLRADWQAASGVPLWDGWGTSETLVLALTAAPGEAVFTASPGIEAFALDEAAAAAGQPTRLLIGGASLALGYHARPAADAEAFRRDGTHELFCPADLFVREVLEDGRAGWRFAGREDSLVKQRGRWVDLVQLEEQLGAGVPGLREAALACIDDEDGLPQLQLFFCADDAGAAQALLAERVRALPPHQRPARLVALDALPRTATGKLLRRALKATRPEVAA